MCGKRERIMVGKVWKKREVYGEKRGGLWVGKGGGLRLGKGESYGGKRGGLRWGK